MRVAMIGHKRFGSREGGVEVVVTELARRMALLGHEIICYDRGGRDVMTGDETVGERVQDGVRVVPVRTIDAKGLAALSSSFSATFKAIRQRPDVIHYHAEGSCVPLRLAHWAGIRTIATIHGLDWQRAKWGKLASLYIKLGERTAARCADEIIVLSKSAQSYFREIYGRETVLVPNGVNVCGPLPANEITKRWNLQEGSFLLYLGRIVPEKGLHYLIEAYKRLDTDKRLVVAGAASDTTNYMEGIKNLARGDERILFTGFVTGDTIAELYSNAYCYILPSDLEGMPLSLLEAMSYGCACVTSDIPECADVLAGTGVTFPRGDAEALRNALDELLRDLAGTRELGRAAYKHVITTYDWDFVLRRTLELYQPDKRRAS